jgi:hypothetical protein
MTEPKTSKAAKGTNKPNNSKPAPAKAKGENKTDKLITLLKREGGATLTDITGATSWLPHSARAMLTGLRKKGFTLDRTKVDGTTRYAITAEPSA